MRAEVVTYTVQWLAYLSDTMICTGCNGSTGLAMPGLEEMNRQIAWQAQQTSQLVYCSGRLKC